MSILFILTISAILIPIVDKLEKRLSRLWCPRVRVRRPRRYKFN